MSDQDRNNPLHGVGLDAMFSDILRHYHWEVLSEQLKFKCLENHPSFAAATKFLKKTKWAREKTEAFYLYRFKQLPIPSDEEHLLPPRERSFEEGLDPREPAVINAGDKPFFDDPISGPKFTEKTFANKKPPRSRAVAKPKAQQPESTDRSSDQNNASPDPWGKWK